MTNLVEKALSLGGGALAMTRDKATEIINGLVEKGEVKREEAQALIDDLVARGQEKRANLRETLAAQVTALKTTTQATQDLLNAGTKEALERAIPELDLLGEQIDNVHGLLREAEKQVEESTRQTLEGAREQLATAQTHLAQAAEKIRTGAVEGAKRDVKALGRTLNKANHILLAGDGTLAMTWDKATAVVNDLVKKGVVKREEARALIDELVGRGEEKRANLRENLAAQVTALSAIMEAIQANLFTGTEEAVERARQELDRLGEQIANVQSRLSGAGARAEESTRRTLEQAREQLATAQAHLAQAVEKIRAGTVEEAQRGVEALRTALDKARDILRKR